ncbi:hypothetical protein VTI28DRAFT_9912 [Corynascus sepedonium]
MMLDSSWMLCWIQNFSGWARNTIRTVPSWAVCKIIRGLHCLLAASQTKKVLPAGVRATFRGNQSASLRSRLLEPDRRRGQLSAILQLHDTTNSPTSRIYQHRCSCLRCSLPDTFSSRKSLAAKCGMGARFSDPDASTRRSASGPLPTPPSIRRRRSTARALGQVQRPFRPFRVLCRYTY